MPSLGPVATMQAPVATMQAPVAVQAKTEEDQWDWEEGGTLMEDDRTSEERWAASPDDGNAILGDAPIKRAFLQYTIVAVGLVVVWYHVVPYLELGWVLVEPRSLPFPREDLGAVALVVAFIYKLLPLVFGGLPQSRRRHQGGCFYGDDDEEDEGNDPKFLRRCGVVIPCHKSMGEIGEVVEAVLRYFEPEHIVVVDNASSPEPPDATWRVLRDVDPRIQYLYVPEGFKTRALLHGTLLLPPEVSYVLHLDDDTVLSDTMIFDEKHFLNDPQVSGITFGIRMRGPSLVARCVDWEFVLFSIQRTFRADMATAFFCHGIIGLWRRDRWLRLLMHHPAMPYGEDAWIGTDCLTKHERIAAELRCWCYTYAPDRLLNLAWWPSCVVFPKKRSQKKNRRRTSDPDLEVQLVPKNDKARQQGYGASSIFRQRAKRWYTNAPRRLSMRLSQLVHYKTSTWSRAIWFRIFMLCHIHQVLYYLLVPLLVISGLHRHHILQWLFVVTLQRAIRTTCIASIVALRDLSLAPDILTLIVYPVYLLFLDFCFVVGHWRSILYYIPLYPIRRHLPSKWAADHDAVVAASRDMYQSLVKNAEEHEDAVRIVVAEAKITTTTTSATQRGLFSLQQKAPPPVSQ